MNETLETCRRLYNDSLGERIADKDVDYWDQKLLLTLRKQDNKYYKQVYSQVLHDVLLRLDKTYEAFFSKLARHPKFKRRGKYNSFTYPQYGGFRFQHNRLVLGFIGAVRIRMHRIPIGTLKTCTIIRNVDQWYACITADAGVEFIAKKPIENAVGVDLGLIRSMILSTGEMIENPKHLKQSAQKIRNLQRSLDKKQKGSKNKEKTRILLAKAWRRVTNQRMDHAHKISTQLAAKYNTVIFEDLKINNLVKNHNLASAIMDVTWGKLREYTAYKVERRGGRVILIDPKGTSQKCSRCGCVVKKDLSVRMHECPSCKLVMDRDHNAALNILKLGLERARAEAEPLLVRRISKFSQGSKKLHTGVVHPSLVKVR